MISLTRCNLRLHLFHLMSTTFLPCYNLRVRKWVLWLVAACNTVEVPRGCLQHRHRRQSSWGLLARHQPQHIRGPGLRHGVPADLHLDIGVRGGVGLEKQQQARLSNHTIWVRNRCLSHGWSKYPWCKHCNRTSLTQIVCIFNLCNMCTIQN